MEPRLKRRSRVVSAVYCTTQRQFRHRKFEKRDGQQAESSACAPSQKKSFCNCVLVHFQSH